MSLQLKTITLLANTESERQTKQRLLGLLKKYHQLERWTFTGDLAIRDDGISHSHPVLTLATNLLSREDEEFVSVYVHENIHHFLSQHPEEFHATMKDVRLLYPKVPAGRASGGARDEDSTYTHLIVGYLELVAMTEIFGGDSAIKTLRKHDYYKWVYKTVLEEISLLKSVVEKNGLTPNSS
jgi:hypothetical protein